MTICFCACVLFFLLVLHGSKQKSLIDQDATGLWLYPQILLRCFAFRRLTRTFLSSFVSMSWRLPRAERERGQSWMCTSYCCQTGMWLCFFRLQNKICDCKFKMSQGWMHVKFVHGVTQTGEVMRSQSCICQIVFLENWPTLWDCLKICFVLHFTNI